MSNSERPLAIVAGHGTFAEGLISALDQICGKGGLFFALSNNGLSGTDIESAIRSAVSENGIRVVFTDLPAGSATIAARRVMRSESDMVLVTGANLAALIEFAFHSGEDPAHAARAAAEKGKAALAAHGPA